MNEKDLLQKWLGDNRIDSFSSEYAEPGYSADKIILTANWNNFSEDELEEIESFAEIEYSDEWTNCYGCSKLVRVSPNSYRWQASFAILYDCELLCLDCLQDSIVEYYESIEDNYRMAATWPIAEKYPPEQYGYVLVKAGYESGWYPSQDDNPKAILDDLHASGRRRVLFAMTYQGQFDVGFAVFVKEEDEDESEDCKGD